jgi:DNA-binding transcriptional ArsR family regulator
MPTRNPIFDILLSIQEIDRTVHEPARLLILSMLYVIDSADFVFLHNQSGLTRGNFSTHITRLEEANYKDTFRVGIGAGR